MFRISDAGSHKNDFARMDLLRAWILDKARHVGGVYLEKVGGRSGDGRGSLLKTGRLAGRLEGICRTALQGVGRDSTRLVHLVRPDVWQSTTGFASGGNKSYHARRCAEIWPDHVWRDKRGRKRDMPTLPLADGYGIALWGYQQQVDKPKKSILDTGVDCSNCYMLADPRITCRECDVLMCSNCRSNDVICLECNEHDILQDGGSPIKRRVWGPDSEGRFFDEGNNQAWCDDD